MVCLKIVYPYTQWLMIIIPTKLSPEWSPEWSSLHDLFPILLTQRFQDRVPTIPTVPTVAWSVFQCDAGNGTFGGEHRVAFGSRGGQHRHTIGQQFEFLLSGYAEVAEVSEDWRWLKIIETYWNISRSRWVWNCKTSPELPKWNEERCRNQTARHGFVFQKRWTWKACLGTHRGAEVSSGSEPSWAQKLNWATCRRARKLLIWRRLTDAAPWNLGWTLLNCRYFHPIPSDSGLHGPPDPRAQVDHQWPGTVPPLGGPKAQTTATSRRDVATRDDATRLGAVDELFLKLHQQLNVHLHFASNGH